MVAILGGLGAATSWATATLASSRSSRMIDPMSVVRLVMPVGLVVAVAPAPFGTPVDLGFPELTGVFALGLSPAVPALLAIQA